MWPFKRKVTIDYCAFLYAQAIQEDINVFKDAIQNHTRENATDQEIKNLEPELWILDIAILGMIIGLSGLPLNIAADLISKIVVFYSPLETEQFKSLSTPYAEAIKHDVGDEAMMILANIFIKRSNIKFRKEYKNVNRSALVWAIGTVATGSFQGLGQLTRNIRRKYNILPE